MDVFLFDVYVAHSAHVFAETQAVVCAVVLGCADVDDLLLSGQQRQEVVAVEGAVYGFVVGVGEEQLAEEGDASAAVLQRHLPVAVSILVGKAASHHRWLGFGHGAKGVETAWKCYGTEEDESVGHVFHVNIALPEARLCNDESTAFFRKILTE